MSHPHPAAPQIALAPMQGLVDDILRELLGMSSQEISELEDEGVI